MSKIPKWPQPRPFQQQALQSLQKYDHTLLMAPTGSGKSLISQRYIHENLKQTRAVLVTPLIALGRQQIQRFQDLKIPVWCGVGNAKQVQFPDQRSGVWVVSPERLVHLEERLFEEWQPNFFIFDEAHCVFDWGEEFRPAFSLLQDLFKRRRILKSFWCSATLRGQMLRSIQATCGASTQVLGQFEIPKNISLLRLHQAGAEKLSWAESWLEKHPDQSGIIYAGTRALAERLASYLSHASREILVYHAGMSSEERTALEAKIERAHVTREAFVVIATSAFGMGMDYPLLRFAILFDPPYSILQLAQALGRVGRTGESSQVFFLWNRHDFLRLKNHCRGRERALDELHRLESWYESPDSPQEALEKDFRDDGVSGNVERETHECKRDSNRSKRARSEDAVGRPGITGSFDFPN